MKPMSIITEFKFSINRDFINHIINTFEGGMFEDIKINYGKKSGHNVLKNSHVVYTLKNSIQTINIKNINVDLIIKYQKIHKDIFFKRIAKVKNEISSTTKNNIRIKTIISFVDNIPIQL